MKLFAAALRHGRDEDGDWPLSNAVKPITLKFVSHSTHPNNNYRAQQTSSDMSRNSSTNERALNSIERGGNKKQESVKRGSALNSHNHLKMGKATSKQKVSETAMAKGQGPSMTVTPATSQPKGTGKTQLTATGSESVLTANSRVILISPYRDKAGSVPQLTFPTFSKERLIEMDHNIRHLEIDLFRPASEPTVFPLQDLSPLCLYRELRTLRITGMMQSYQSMFWPVIWLNPQLTDLTLEMAGEAEPLDEEAIAKAQEYARHKPTMREVAQGKTTTEVLDKFHIVNLTLTNFVIGDAPFRWFSETTLQKVELHRCRDAGFEMPSVMERKFKIIVTA